MMKQEIERLRLSRKAGLINGRNSNSAYMPGIGIHRRNRWLPGRVLRRKGADMKKRKRTYKEIKQSSKNHYEVMAERTPAEKAKDHMQHKPYAALMIRRQAEQIGGGNDNGT